ncbi:T9SS type A sorting domain-containing protein [Phaeocystidibacter luteus]|uniref:T9SS type A sorting domain-containing protein n=1 Tax=Phaeocystidibacter luteus TaxID=911197 RepID=A0A6N6RL59_9FLAO|nr:T9SS type A sorting domain-containing protein [Phaeocystidibacter luteus]KAB2813712.1 T9SS type A sorting domain-containing protein [Phaeocystidibacter luteus]
MDKLSQTFVFAKRKCSLVLGCVILLGFNAFSQVILSDEIYSGFTQQYPASAGLSDAGTSDICYTALSKSGVNYVMSLRLFDKVTLQKKDSLFIATFSTDAIAGWRIDQVDNQYFAISFGDSNSTTLQIFDLDFSNVTSNKVVDTVFSTGFMAVTSFATLGNDHFVHLGRGTGGDSSLAVVYDSNWHFNRSKYYWRNAPLESTFRYGNGPYLSPRDPTEIIFGIDARALFMDLQSLEVQSILNPVAFDPHSSATYSEGYSFRSDGFYYGGTVVHDSDFFTTGNSHVFQTFVAFRDYESDTVHLKRFGNIRINERCYAYLYNETSNQHITASSRPFDNPNLGAIEQRTVVIRKSNEWGVDSIELFGNDNHVVLDLLSVADDVYGVARYFEQNQQRFEDIIFKLPRFALGESEEVRAQFSVYPNPTKDYIIISGIEELTNAQVVSAVGQSIHQKLEFEGNRINLESLPEGVYVLSLTHSDGEYMTKIVIDR